MILSHVVSDGILCVTALLSLAWYRKHLSGGLRAYLSITVTLVGATSLLGALRYMGLSAFSAPTELAALLGETVGIAAFALAFWCAMMAPVARPVGVGVLLAALAVFAGAVSFETVALSLPVQGAGILTLLFLAIARRRQFPTATRWLGIGLLLFVGGAVAYPVLSGTVDAPLLESLDIYHYCVAAAILAINRSAASLATT
jgi:hypothetical protein